MSIVLRILIGSLSLLVACKDAKEKEQAASTQISLLKDTVILDIEGIGPKVLPVETYPPPDNDPSYYARKGANQDVYDFMLAVIEELSLNRKSGLIALPKSSCIINMKDEDMIDSMLIGKPKPVKEWQQGDVFSGSLAGLPECLTLADKADMLNQKKKLAGFVWDNSRLGFNRAHSKFNYTFSVPLFSKDRTKAILFIAYLCPGLCGSGETVLFEKKENKWQVEQKMAMHYY
jgi:hypothetical protein